MRISFEPHSLLVFIFVTGGGGGGGVRLSGARETGARPLPCHRGTDFSVSQRPRPRAVDV